MTVRLGVNIDHIATLRNARGGVPDPARAAAVVVAAAPIRSPVTRAPTAHSLLGSRGAPAPARF